MSAAADLAPDGTSRPVPGPAGVPAAGWRALRVYPPTVIIAGVAGWLGWAGWTALSAFGPARSINAGRFELAGPVVLGFVLVMFGIEQLHPAVRRPLLARGHVIDMCYLLAYALLVVPVVVLIGTAFPGCWPGMPRGW